jgi:hypothetical protein
MRAIRIVAMKTLKGAKHTNLAIWRVEAGVDSRRGSMRTRC